MVNMAPYCHRVCVNVGKISIYAFINKKKYSGRLVDTDNKYGAQWGII